MNLPYTKIITIAVLLSGLISIPLFFAPAKATINHVITGDTQKYRIFEGQAPTMQPSDAGMATNPMPGTFEWWSCQGKFNDNSTVANHITCQALAGQQRTTSALRHYSTHES